MKKKLLIGIIAVMIFIAFVGAVFYPEPFGNNLDINDYNISNADYVFANVLEATSIYVTSIFGSNSWCYQESANTSTTCGGLSTGLYVNSSDWTDINSTHDGNWSTYASYTGANGTTGYLYVNYTKPSPSLASSLWTIKRASAINNYTIDSICWSNHSTTLLFRGVFVNYTGNRNHWQCYNGSDFVNVTASQSGFKLYEEAMTWKLSSDASINGTLDWTKLQNYPTACPTGAITAINDSVTCSDTIIFGGNVTAENVYLPSYLSTHTNVSITAVEGVWLNVTFDTHEDSEKFRINHTYSDATNDTFIIISNGTYRFGYGISFLDTAASPDSVVAIRILKNNAEIHGSVFEKDTTKQNALGTVYRSILASLDLGDEIKLQFISNATSVSLQTAATYGDHPTSAGINLYRIS